MRLDRIRQHCLAKSGTTEGFPFDGDTLVFKVAGKMFALTNVSNPVSINLKCDPERALELRAKHEEVRPGYHMNKKHWNTVRLDGLLDDAFIAELIQHSYELVVSGLTRAQRRDLGDPSSSAGA